MPAIILENIRSSYNVWNIIRTADALWFDIIISWYTPSPSKEKKILKTSLWSEKSVKIIEIYNTLSAISYAKEKYWFIISAEISDNAISLSKFKKNIIKDDFAIIFWNEITWVLKESLDLSDAIIFINMLWKKESLNVWQASAIFMWEFQKEKNW